VDETGLRLLHRYREGSVGSVASRFRWLN